MTADAVAVLGTGIKGSALHSPIINNAGLPENAGNFLSADQKLDWFGTVRARLGVTITPDLLLYGTGGLAYGGVNDSANGKFVRFEISSITLAANPSGAFTPVPTAVPPSGSS